MCAPSFDDVVLTNTPDAIVNAGSDGETCKGVNYPFTTQATLASAGNFSSLLWTHDGIGIIFNPTTLTPTYQPGTTETGIVTFTLTANGNGSCGSVSDLMQLTVTPSVIVNAGSDAATCEGATYNFSTQTTTASASQYSSLLWTSTGTGIISNATTLTPDYQPGTGESGIVTFTLTGSGNGSCADVADQMVLVIEAEPVGVSNAIGVCSDEALGAAAALTTTGASASSFTILSINNPSSLVSSAGSPVTGTGKGANELIDDAWTNTGTIQGIITYTIGPVGSIVCTGIPFTVTVTVDPEPTGLPLSVTVCSDAAPGPSALLSTMVGAASGYNISTNSNGLIQSGGTVSAGLNMGATELEDDAWTNHGLTFVNVIYTVIPVAAGTGCLGDPFTVTIQVDPEPAGTVISMTQCSDVALGLGVVLSTTGSSIAATSYNIATNANGLTQTGGIPSAGLGMNANELVDDAWRNLSIAPVNVVYTIVPVGGAGSCVGDPFTVTATINPEPVGAVKSVTVCSDDILGTPVTLSTAPLSISAASYSILAISNASSLTSSAGFPAIGSGLGPNELIDQAWTNTDPGPPLPAVIIYTANATSSSGCTGDPFTITVNVNPEPVGLVLTITVCSNQVVGAGLTLSTTVGSIGASGYNISTNANG